MSDLLLSSQEQKYLTALEDLNKPREDGLKLGLKTRLHSGQIDALSYLYSKGKKLLFIPSGRKFGKTELAVYALYRQCMLHDRSACYYITPEASQGRKIVWDTFRIQQFLGADSKKYIKSIKNVEMKVEFINGSFIQVIGSENFGAANGLTPHLAVYDEYKRFAWRWHIDFAPNLIPKAAPLIIIGTLPTPGDINLEQYYEVLNGAKKDPSAAVIFKTTYDNPLNHMPKQKQALEEEITRLIARGEEDVVQREYYSKIIAGGKRSIFPMFTAAEHVKPHHAVVEHISKDIGKLEPCVALDPGNSTVFGGLFGVLNRYTGTLYIGDELYQRSQKETSSGVVLPILRSKVKNLTPSLDIKDDWLKVCDDAAAWWLSESANRSEEEALHFFPAEKWKGTREDGLSLIKDMLIHKKLIISDRCENLIREIEGYALDSSGKISNKIDDHCIDALRYMLIALGYNFELLTDTLQYQDEVLMDKHSREERYYGYEKDTDYVDPSEGLGYDDGFDF